MGRTAWGWRVQDDHESDPSRRYKMVFNRYDRQREPGDPNRRYMSAGFSPDGIHWRDFHDCREMEAPGDTHSNWFWSPDRSRYVVITRLFQQKPFERLVARSESADFLHWSKAE